MFVYTLSSFAFFFGVSAIQFHSVLFENKGFLGYQFSLLMTAGSLAGIFSPLVMAFVLKYFSKSTHLLLLLMAAAGILIPLMPRINSFYPMLAIFFIQAFCVWSMFPLLMSCGLDVCREKGDYFFFILRSVGTAGFLAGCCFALVMVNTRDLGWLYNFFGAAYLFSLIAMVILIFTSRSKPELFNVSNSVSIFSKKSLLRILTIFRDRVFILLLISTAFLTWANSMVLGVQGNYIINNLDGDASKVSLAWILCSAFEIPIMFFCLYILKHRSLASVLIMSMSATMLRVMLMAVPDSPLSFGAGLLLHGFYYAGVVTGIGICIDRTYKKYRTLFQIIAAFIYTGIPSSLGNFMTGIIWKYSSLQMVYYVSLGIMLISLFIFLYLIKPLKLRF